MALVFDIQRFSLNDGPGIRTTVFLKGCPLRCPWCHNPESKSFCPQLSYHREACVSCGACRDVCPRGVHELGEEGHTVDFQRCTACGRCAQACPTGALRLVGREQSPAEVFALAVRDTAYYRRSGGGVTLSGGEPLCHPAFGEALFRLCREAGIHTCLETSGAGPKGALEQFIGLTDLFLFDIKASRRLYPSLIGVDFDTVYRRLLVLEEYGARVRLRLPMVPGVNDDSERLEEALELSRLSCVEGVEPLPYHDIGRGKARQIGSAYPTGYQVPKEETVLRWQEIFRPTGKLLVDGRPA